MSEAELNRIKAATSRCGLECLRTSCRVFAFSICFADPDQSRPDVPIIEDPFTLALEIRPELQALDHAVQAFYLF